MKKPWHLAGPLAGLALLPLGLAAAEPRTNLLPMQQPSSCDNTSVDQPICLTLNQDQTATLGSGLVAKIDNVTFGPSFTNAVGDKVDFSSRQAMAVTVQVTVANNSGKEQELS